MLRDSVDYEVAVSNETGYVDWTYTGGYGGEYEFKAIAGDTVLLTATGHTGPTSLSKDTDNGECKFFALLSTFSLLIIAVF